MQKHIPEDCPDCTTAVKLNNYVSSSEIVAQRGGSLGRGFPIKTLVLIKSRLGARLQRVCRESEQHEGQLRDPTEHLLLHNLHFHHQDSTEHSLQTPHQGIS